MNDKKGFLQKAGDFLSGKGFYIALFASVAVLGLSAWILVSSFNTDEMTMQDPEESKITRIAPKPVYVPEPVDDSIDTSDDSEDVFYEDEPVYSDEPEELTFVWPVSGRIERPYSTDALIYSKTMADWRTHDGVDISAELGTTVMAVADGVVESVYTDDLFGTTVVIDHGRGIESVYSNLAGTPAVSEGDAISMCSVIGSVGDTALAEAVEVPHLHFTMLVDGSPADPFDFLPDR